VCMRTLTLAFAAFLLATPAAAEVQVQPLAAPDYFSQGARDTGLPADLWRGTSPEVARALIPLVGRKPLSPAAASLARRLLATGANGPDVAGRDPQVAAARIQALLALGHPRDAWLASDRAANLPISPELSQAVAETALIVGEDDRACRIADELTVSRGELYWLRLRAYCQAKVGQTEAAQLTLTLAGEKQRDPVLSRLIGAVIAGAGDPGAASLRTGLEYSLSRRLALDIPAASKSASPAVLAMVQPVAVPAPTEGLAERFIAVEGRAAEFDALISQLEAADAKARPRYEAAVLVAVALGAEPTARQRAVVATIATPPGLATPGRLAALDAAAGLGLKGETALQVLAIAAEADGKPLRPADTARIVAALIKVELRDDAIAFAADAFTALQVQ
jgi:hypothetical protein